MITKAYIQEVLSRHKVRVRIPLYHKIKEVNGSVPDDLLPAAFINSPPNIKIEPQVGDVVIVDFEEDDLAKPVILGYLYSSNDCNSSMSIVCEDFTASGEISLSKDTTIGDIKYENIECLKNQKDNIPNIIKSIRSDITNLSNELTTTNKNVGYNTSGLKAMDDYKLSVTDSLNSLSQRVQKLEEDAKGIIERLDDYVKRYPMIIGGNTYGTNPGSIKDPQEGQVYFTILPEDK